MSNVLSLEAQELFNSIEFRNKDTKKALLSAFSQYIEGQTAMNQRVFLGIVKLYTARNLTSAEYSFALHAVTVGSDFLLAEATKTFGEEDWDAEMKDCFMLRDLSRSLTGFIPGPLAMYRFLAESLGHEYQVTQDVIDKADPRARPLLENWDTEKEKYSFLKGKLGIE